jgi:hypothetical protein
MLIKRKEAYSARFIRVFCYKMTPIPRFPSIALDDLRDFMKEECVRDGILAVDICATKNNRYNPKSNVLADPASS